MGVDASAVARVLGIETTFKDLREGSVLFLPQRIAILAQGSSTSVYSTTKKQITSAVEAGSTYGTGSPIHLAARELLPLNGDGVGTIPVTVYPLEDGYEAVAATGSVTPSGTATESGEYRVNVNGILSEPFVIAAGAITVGDVVDDIVARVNAVLEMPVIVTDGATVANFEAKWAGPSGNDLQISIVGPSVGVDFAIVQPTGGLVNPSITAALAQIGTVWETMLLNCLNIADTTILDEYSTFGEGRWGVLQHKPLLVFSGETEADRATATTLTDGRKTDRTNSQLVLPGSSNLPFVVAARQLARIAKQANENPPVDYASDKLESLTPGTSGEQWQYADRDAAVKAGSSTVEVVDDVAQIADVVTMYHPTGDPIPAYRYVVDVVKLQNIIFNMRLRFATKEWAKAVLIPDEEPTVNPSARKPRDALTEMASVIDSLADWAIIVDRKFSKAQTTASINSMNPKRLDVKTTVKLSGNANIISLDLNFGFFFGQASAA